MLSGYDRHAPAARLTDLVEGAYRAFVVPVPVHWSGDDTGLAPDNWRRLSTVPLRQLTPHDLSHFSDETPGTLPRHEVRYLLPRYLDLLACGKRPQIVGVEASLAVLRRSGYREAWTESEQVIIEEFLAAFLEAFMANPDYFDFDTILGEVLCMVACAGSDAPALLPRLDRAPPPLLARSVARWVNSTYGPTWRESLRNAFWQNLPGEDAVLDWLAALDPPRYLERAFFNETDPVWRDLISQAQVSTETWGLSSQISA